MRLPRLTTRWWMVAVAVAGLLAWPAARRLAFQVRAAEHRRDFDRLFREMQDSAPWRERLRLNDDWVHRRPPPGGEFSEEAILAAAQRTSDELDRRYRRRLEYHRTMERKYEEAARRPWLPVPPDPPPPGPGP